MISSEGPNFFELHVPHIELLILGNRVALERVGDLLLENLSRIKYRLCLVPSLERLSLRFELRFTSHYYAVLGSSG